VAGGHGKPCPYAGNSNVCLPTRGYNTNTNFRATGRRPYEVKAVGYAEVRRVWASGRHSLLIHGYVIARRNVAPTRTADAERLFHKINLEMSYHNMS
jgi:hypothetical protein